MKYKFSLFIFIYLLLPIFSCGQKNIGEYKNQIKFTRIRLLDLVNPGIEFSYERINKKFATQFLATYLNDLFGLVNYQKYNGIRIGIEEKLFLNYRKLQLDITPKTSKKYISTEIVLSKIYYKDISRFGIENPLENIQAYDYNYLDTFTVKKTTMALNVKYGFEIVFKHIVFDFNFGVGLKYKDVSHYDRRNPQDKLERPRHPNVYYFSNKEMNEFTISIPANVKIGYCF